MEGADRDVAFFSHTVLHNDFVEITDAQSDDRFKNNPLATQAPHIRFYTGMPIIMPTGEKIGTLCVIDQHKKELTPSQKAMLKGFAKVAAKALVSREHAAQQIEDNAHK